MKIEVSIDLLKEFFDNCEVHNCNYCKYKETYCHGKSCSDSIIETLIERSKYDKLITDHMKECDEKLRLFSASGSLSPVLLLTSYCGKCTEANPCEDCLKMCNIAFIDKDAIKNKNVVCGYDFMEDYRYQNQ